MVLNKSYKDVWYTNTLCISESFIASSSNKLSEEQIRSRFGEEGSLNAHLRSKNSPNTT